MTAYKFDEKPSTHFQFTWWKSDFAGCEGCAVLWGLLKKKEHNAINTQVQGPGSLKQVEGPQTGASAACS